MDTISQPPFIAYSSSISPGSSATIPYDLAEYREIGLEFQGTNANAPYWIVMPSSTSTLQVGNVVGINGDSTQCGITFGAITINPTSNTITNVRMSLLYYSGSAWNISDNTRSIAKVWLKR